LTTEAAKLEGSNVSFLGRVDSVPEFLSAVDIYFQPSHYEGLCITVLEAMAAGKPIVASTAGEIPQNVRHGADGFIADPTAVESFVDAIQNLANSPGLRSEFGNAAQERVADRYSQQILVEKFLRVIEETHGIPQNQ
jgi:glycosyltransferase involved in cell wall biosynthesis